MTGDDAEDDTRRDPPGVRQVVDLNREGAAAREREAAKMRAISHLAGSVAHDLNNLLMTILGNAEMLTAKLETNANLLEMAQLIEEAGQRAADLTRRLLAVAGRQPLRPERLDINRFMVDLEMRLRPDLGSDIAIELVQGAGAPQAMVDPAALQTIIFNLVTNAREAMVGGGHLSIAIGAAQIDGPAQYLSAGDYAAISVADTGTGMPPEISARAFEPFFTTKRGVKGAGLGLSVVYGLVNQLRGQVTLASAPGKGTTVEVLLPLAPTAAETAVARPLDG